MGMSGLGKDMKLNMGALNGMMRGAQARDRLRAKLAKKNEERSKAGHTVATSKFSKGEKVVKSSRKPNTNKSTTKTSTETPTTETPTTETPTTETPTTTPTETPTTETPTTTTNDNQKNKNKNKNKKKNKNRKK
jgi:hypothetical protein